MSYFFVSVLQAFLPVALLLGLSWAVRPAPALNRVIWITILMAIAGVWAGSHYPKSQQLQLVLAVVQLVALLLFLFSQLILRQSLGYLWQVLLVLGAAFNWGNNPNLGAFTNTHVINTDLLLNLAAIVMAFAWVVFSAVLLLMMIRQLSLAITAVVNTIIDFTTEWRCDSVADEVTGTAINQITTQLCCISHQWACLAKLHLRAAAGVYDTVLFHAIAAGKPGCQ